MEGSDLKNALSTVCRPNAVKKIKQGKEISRGVKVHILTDAALVFQLQRMLLENNKLNMADASEAVWCRIFMAILYKMPISRNVKTLAEECLFIKVADL